MENYFDPLAESLKYGDYSYIKFKIKNTDDLIFEYGEAIPWFGELGGAVQLKSSKGFHEYSGDIEILEKWSLISGQWQKMK